jgi:excisionase family DNA binding protein
MSKQQQRLQRAYGSRREVAEYLGIPLATLERWAYLGKGPAFVKIGRHTRYDWAGVDSWIAAQPQGGAQSA